MHLFKSPVRNNRAGTGGGIFNDNGGTMSLVYSPVTGSVAAQLGGGIANTRGATITLIASAVSGNSASAGGGIANFDRTVFLAFSPVTGNMPNNCAPAGSVPGCTK